MIRLSPLPPPPPRFSSLIIYSLTLSFFCHWRIRQRQCSLASKDGWISNRRRRYSHGHGHLHLCYLVFPFISLVFDASVLGVGVFWLVRSGYE